MLYNFPVNWVYYFFYPQTHTIIQLLTEQVFYLFCLFMSVFFGGREYLRLTLNLLCSLGSVTQVGLNF